MITISKISGFVMLISVTIAGCQSGGSGQMEAVELAPDATPMSMGELYNYFAEQTQVREGGGVYYTEFGTLVELRDGKREQGTWASFDNGKVCRKFKDREDGPCETYYRNGDDVAIEIDGKVAMAPKKLEGDQLDLLETGSARKLYTLWDGSKETGKWSVTDKGALCWHVPSWGNGPCESYYMGQMA